MRHPTEYGLLVPIRELGFERGCEPMRRLNNHHLYYPARIMARLVVTQTLRDLEAYQTILPIARHDEYHSLYEPPEIDIKSVFDRVMQAYDDDERLRIGSARNPTYKQISDVRLAKIKQEYGEVIV